MVPPLQKWENPLCASMIFSFQTGVISYFVFYFPHLMFTGEGKEASFFLLRGGEGFKFSDKARAHLSMPSESYPLIDLNSKLPPSRHSSCRQWNMLEFIPKSVLQKISAFFPSFSLTESLNSTLYLISLCGLPAFHTKTEALAVKRNEVRTLE